MASSQVEIAAASAPFGCILRDHNRRDRCRDSNALRKNLKDLVTRINISPDSNDNERRPDKRKLKIQEKDVLEEPPSALSPRQSRVPEWCPCRETQDTTSMMEKQCHEAELLASDQSVASFFSDQSETGPSNLGASSLVQIWEARLGQSHTMNRAATASTRSNSPLSCSNEDPSRKSGLGYTFDESRLSHDGLIGDWESDRAVPEGTGPFSSSTSTSSSISQDQNPDPRESLKTPRVADIIRRLTSAGDENENELLSNAGTESPSRERDRSVGSDHSLEQKGFVVHMTNSPRLRGRQAFNDLLVIMERDRQKELNSLGERQAVSRFSQRGRIQANLRLKVLQRGMAVYVQAQQRPRSSGSTEGSTSSHSSAIVHLREKFKVESSKAAETTRNGTNANPYPPQTQSMNNWHGSEDRSSITSDQTIVTENHHVEVRDIPKQDSVPEQMEPVIAEDLRDERSITSNITYQMTRFEAHSLDLHEQEVSSFKLQEQTESFTSINGCWYEEGMVEEEGQESNMEEELTASEGGYEWFLGVSRPRSYWEDQRQAWYRKMLENESENSEIRRLLERRSVSTFLNSDFRDRMNCLMMNHLQGQTHQMSEQEDDMSNEERMNRFLSSCLQSHCRSADGQEEKQEEELEEKVEEVIQEEEAFQEKDDEEQTYSRSQERRGQLMEEEEEEGEEEQIYMTSQQVMGQPIPTQLNAARVRSQEGDGMGLQEGGYREREEEEEEEKEENQVEEDEEQGDILIEEDNYEGEGHSDEYMEEEEDEAEEEEVEEEDESLLGQRYHEASQYFDHSNPSSVTMPSPTFMRSWGYRSHEMSNNDHQPLASTSSRETLNSTPYYNGAWQHLNSIDRLTIEMELINELRGQMKQLYQEMSELRKSINCCMDMQVKLQDSIKAEMISVRGERKKPQQRASRKGHCRICYKKQVDSLLYRCGHMCTCVKCALELQWNSGNCPICRAPIKDVVRVHGDS